MLLKLFKCQVLGQGLFADADDGAGAVLGEVHGPLDSRQNPSGNYAVSGVVVF